MSVDPVAISRSALDVEWQRMQVIALNLANENSAAIGGRGGFRPQTLVSGPQQSFAGALAKGTSVQAPQGVKVIAVEARSNGVKRSYDPNHPAADSAGFVNLPNIDHAEEMVSLMRSARIYEGNLTALSLTQQMSMRALDIGRR